MGVLTWFPIVVIKSNGRTLKNLWINLWKFNKSEYFFNLYKIHKIKKIKIIIKNGSIIKFKNKDQVFKW